MISAGLNLLISINQFLAIWYFCKETVTCGNIRYCTTKAVCYGDN